jgi:hypothetical protein
MLNMAISLVVVDIAGVAQHDLDRWVAVHLGPEQTDEVPVSQTHRPEIAVEVEQSYRTNVPERLAERDIPIDLVGERIPSEAHDRHSGAADELNVVPLTP